MTQILMTLIYSIAHMFHYNNEDEERRILSNQKIIFKTRYCTSISNPSVKDNPANGLASDEVTSTTEK